MTTTIINQLRKAALRTVTGCLFAFSSFSSAIAQEYSSNLHLGFCYPLSTNGVKAPEYSNQASFHVLAGVSKEERSFAFAGISNIILDKASGFQFAGISNHIKNRADGFQFAGLMNRTGKSMEGFQFAGIYNDVSKADGFQFSGLLNRTDEMNGFQFAGFSNIVSRDARNFQFAGFSNITGGNFEGFQFAGFMNKAGDVHGAQFAGFINQARDIDGFRFAGFINIARKVRGFQFAGFLNIADSSDHSLALVNIIKKGEMSLAATTDETQSTLLTFRSGGRIFYGILGAGYNWKLKDNHVAFEGGFGVHLPFSDSFRINTELSELYLEDWHKGEYYKGSLRIVPALKLARNIELTAGPSLNFSVADTQEGMDLIKKDLWHDDAHGNKYQLFIGYNAGLQYRLK